jgi:hypothetical protein
MKHLSGVYGAVLGRYSKRLNAGQRAELASALSELAEHDENCQECDRLREEGGGRKTDGPIVSYQRRVTSQR